MMIRMGFLVMGMLASSLTYGRQQVPKARDGLVLKPTRIQETIVFLHGMNRTRASMWILQRRFHQAGYRTISHGYWAAFNTLDQLALDLVVFIKNHVKTQRYHLVAHSLGNLVIRKAFKFGFPKKLGRIVMIAPPNHPPKIARYWKDNAFYHMLFGKTGQSLASVKFYKDIPLPHGEFGVIAGNSGISLLREPNDGTVTVRETKLSNMKDFVVLNREHTFIMNGKDTFDQAKHFIEHGRFKFVVQKSAPVQSRK